MGGELSYTSEPGKGSTFSFSIDLTIKDQEGMSNETATAKVVGKGTIQRGTAVAFDGEVLLVDDNQTNLLVCSMMLERMGLNVRTASDGQEALDIMSKVGFNLVLMDITMPEMDGETATKILRSQGNTTPVIALTAHVGADLDTQYLASGMQEVVHKPIVREDLVNALANYLPFKKDIKEQVPNELPEENANIDIPTLASLIEAIGHENFQRAYGLFVTETSQRISKLLTAWIQRDMTSLSREAHTLSSSVSSFGALTFGKLLKSIELSSRKQDIPTLIKLITKVETTHQQSMESFDEYQSNKL